MFKLRKYVRPFLGSILVIIALLFGQAMCELAMPDYMSDIVNVGINAGGIENGVFDALSETRYDQLALLMNEEEKTIFQNSYTLTTPQSATESEREKYPALANENVYILNDLSSQEKEALNQALSQAEAMVMSLEQLTANTDLASLNEQQQQILTVLENLPEGTTIFDILAKMPQKTLDTLREQFASYTEVMGQSTLDTANASLVKQEYQSLGMNTDHIQYRYLFENGAKMLFVALASAALAVAVGFLASRVAAGFSRDLRRDVFGKVESFSNAEFNQFSTNTLITRTTNDVQQIQMVLVMILRIVIYAPIIGIGAIIKVLQSDANMTWIIALVVVIILGIMLSAFVLVLPKFRIQQKLLDKLNSVVREFLEGMPVIRAFNNQQEEQQKFRQANNDIMRTALFTGRAMGSLMPLIMLVMNCSSILIVWVGSHQIDAGSLQVGDMMAFMQYAMQIIMAFMMITMISIMLPRASVAAGRIVEVLQTKPAILEAKDPVAFDPARKGQVSFQHVSFRYPGAEEEVLHDLSFTCEPGKTTAFIGSTGSGKSTIVNLVPRFFDVTEGKILVDGVDLREADIHDLRDRIGYVPQKASLFSGTIESNLRYANEDATDEQLKEAAKIAQALDFIEAKPDGFASEIAQGGTNVSGGQRQRLSIARALVKQPEIFIFDDTFSALDFKTDAQLRKELNQLCEKKQSTVLLVAQRISSIMHADQIIVIDNGRIVGRGKHQELLENCDVYKEIAYSQLSKEELENARS
ncbi:MAG TPA: ABC transporter ATP-binding protein [Candidatus Fimiplasma intestinipullorum]|uniref:ABC transporter ATP-binding protein n=1 Tax=Candidatus Fimiplasma intestinipullorum TaxID=2840825 RepID=A0A9D1HM30_9FIRM|nr:ABC transporter ATP-binding protein [Candidatus Fimiplasma intestinipullorum]